MQTMNKVRALHMKEAIIILCLVLWCINAAAASWHAGVDEWGRRAATGALCSRSCQDICLYAPCGWFHAGPSYLCVSVCLCRTVLLHNTHILHLPSSHSSSDRRIQYCQHPQQAKKGRVNVWWIRVFASQSAVRSTLDTKPKVRMSEIKEDWDRHTKLKVVCGVCSLSFCSKLDIVYEMKKQTRFSVWFTQVGVWVWE